LRYNVAVAAEGRALLEMNVEATSERDAINTAKLIVGYECGWSESQLEVTILLVDGKRIAA
jgi:hypothetical protein